MKNEQQMLLKQSRDITLHGVGAIAGAFQMAAGGGICFGSGGFLCPTFGIAFMLHGANNVYENGRNLAQGRSDTQGPVRKVYQSAAKMMGGGEREGNMAYGAVDIGMSAFGAGRMVLKKDAWRLFRCVRTDYVQAYKQASKKALAVDVVSGSYTLKTMHSESQRNDN
ncbi:MAG: DUF4225 domain-containing protein [Negativicutes bacterium]|nr:DUF4225 domain-containing protein [Negativicutes bacterium]